MARDNRRISAPKNCISPNTFKERKELEPIVNKNGLRLDGRIPDALRPISLKVGFVPSVTGSAYLECGRTKIITSVTGPRDVLHKSDSMAKGQVYCEFKYAMFSCKKRQSYLPSTEELYISKAIQDALEPVILLHKFPKARLDISILVLEDDGAAISSAITCAGAALSNAGVEIYDIPIGCTIVYTGSHMLIDPTALEESNIMNSEFGKITAGMMVAYNNQFIYMDSCGNLKYPIISQCMKSVQSACQTVLLSIREHLKQHVGRTECEESATNGGSMEKIMAAELKLFQPQKYISTYLENNIRPDGRSLKEFRPILINVGSIDTADGSALARLGDTFVLCGIKADLTNPTPEEPNKGFFVPNVTLTPICSNQFSPGPPTEQAQVYSQMIMDLWRNSAFLEPTTLCIFEGKLAWCLFVEMVCLSFDGNVLDACVLALMAALRNTQLPEVIVNEENNQIEVTDRLFPLNLNYLVFSATYAILKNGVVVDPSAEEENLADSSCTIFITENETVSVQSVGQSNMDQIFHCIDCSKTRHSEMVSLLQTLN